MRTVRNRPQDRHPRHLPLWHLLSRILPLWGLCPKDGEDRDAEIDLYTFFFLMLHWRRLWRKQHGKIPRAREKTGYRTDKISPPQGYDVHEPLGVQDEDQVWVTCFVNRELRGYTMALAK